MTLGLTLHPVHLHLPQRAAACPTVEAQPGSAGEPVHWPGPTRESRNQPQGVGIFRYGSTACTSRLLPGLLASQSRDIII